MSDIMTQSPVLALIIMKFPLVRIFLSVRAHINLIIQSLELVYNDIWDWMFRNDIKTKYTLVFLIVSGVNMYILTYNFKTEPCIFTHNIQDERSRMWIKTSEYVY